MEMILVLFLGKRAVTASNITPKLNKQGTLVCVTLSHLQGCGDVRFGRC